ncbi:MULTISPECIES: aminoglycoside adenylyltransferase domain-containing protein [Shinella]|uniref:Aminoglycoside (3'') (9) adenylyltransferase n=1 Tax=Shinella sumterensis TaxID=1967501 RepID=A0AA50CLV9_9HYPH|nr:MULTISPECIES: aminoglycoside adenylyltransferase domain-containing protein [Shinella]WLR98377.1 DUF4111 domain-containing protein [Shinella sumterensis]
MQPVGAQQTETAIEALRGVFGDGLLAVYLHGSAVSGGLQPQSDIDLMTVVDGAMDTQQRGALLSALLRISARYPAPVGGPRCLEVMVLQRADLVVPAYPARAEFLYGEWLRDAFDDGELPMPVCDPEITLVLAQARQAAIALAGSQPEDVLPAIPSDQIRCAMADLLPSLVAGLEGDERNGMLTLARMWRTAARGDFVSKDEAATWAAARMPEPESKTLLEARDAYLGRGEDAWWDRPQAVRAVTDCLRVRVEALLKRG